MEGGVGRNDRGGGMTLRAFLFLSPTSPKARVCNGTEPTNVEQGGGGVKKGETNPSQLKGVLPMCFILLCVTKRSTLLDIVGMVVENICEEDCRTIPTQSGSIRLTMWSIRLFARNLPHVRHEEFLYSHVDRIFERGFFSQGYSPNLCT